MAKKLLVLSSGTDDPNAPALRRALECGGRAAEIEVLDVVYEPLLEGYLGNREIYEPLRRRVLEERRERADVLAQVAVTRGATAVAKAIWDHPLHEAVAKETAARGTDLLVTAPRLSSEAPGLSHGDWQLLISCPVPALIVRSDGRRPYRHIVAAVDPFHAHAKPAALDAEILRNARLLQQATEASLTVLHCYTPVTHFGTEPGWPPASDHRLEEARRQALRALLDDAGIPPAAACVLPGEPHSVLQALAASGEADLIVMGALARGRLKELLIGHTAERVLHHGSVDVLVVKPPTLEAAGENVAA